MPIRKAAEYETQQIINQSLTVLSEASMGYIPATWKKAQQMVTPFLADGGYYLVSLDHNNIQGWVGVGRTINIYTDEPVGMIPELYVLPQHRHKGIAEQLCREAMNRLHASGYTAVQLNVFTGNSSQQLYQKLGFREVATLMEKRFE